MVDSGFDRDSGAVKFGKGSSPPDSGEGAEPTDSPDHRLPDAPGGQDGADVPGKDGGLDAPTGAEDGEAAASVHQPRDIRKVMDPRRWFVRWLAGKEGFGKSRRWYMKDTLLEPPKAVYDKHLIEVGDGKAALDVPLAKMVGNSEVCRRLILKEHPVLVRTKKDELARPWPRLPMTSSGRFLRPGLWRR